MSDGTEAKHPPDPLIGATVGSYKVVSELGRGGMGAVYVAEHTIMGKKAAVKVLLPKFSADKDMVQRFFNEAKSAALIDHSGIVDVYDFGFHESGVAYLVMELLQGESLTSRMQREGCLSLEVIVAIARQVCTAVGEAHQQKIVHRDLKPDNVYLVPDPEMPHEIRVKVLDFGIAKLADEGAPDEVKTQAGEMLGTPWYMSPEQCKGAGEVDGRSDVYALGCIIYEMATGTVPFDEKGTGALIAAHIYENPPPPRTIDSNMDPRLETVILKTLAKDPKDRQQTMEQLTEELEACLTAPAPVAAAATAAASVAAPAAAAAAAAAPVTAAGAATATPTPTVAAAGGSAKKLYYIAGGVVVLTGVIAIVAMGGKKKSEPQAALPVVMDAAVRVPDAAPPAPTSCDQGDLPDCIVQAGKAEHGDGVPKDTARAAAMYRKACEGGVTDACVKAGARYEYFPAAEADPKIAFDMYKRGCDASKPEACVHVGLAYEHGFGVERDLTRAFAMYIEACDRKYADGCARLAVMYQDGRGIAADTSKAVALFTRACDGGSAFACTGLSEMYATGLSVGLDPAKALVLAGKACDADDVMGCLATGFLYQQAASPDAARSAAAFDKTAQIGPGKCDAQDFDACTAVLILGRARNDEKLPIIGIRACGLGSARTCTVAGVIAEDEKRPVQAREFFQRACDGGDREGCAGLGRMMLVTDDVDEAVDLFEKACNGGSGQAGCAELAALYETGRGVTKDEGRATHLYKKGCDAGGYLSCLALAPRYAEGKPRKDERKARAAAERACAIAPAGCTALARFAATGVGGQVDVDQAKQLYARACTAGDQAACALKDDPLPAPDAGVPAADASP